MIRVIDSFRQDLRFGTRVLVKNPGFTVVAVVVLALGIGANSAIFSLVNMVLLRPLPVERPDALVGVYARQTISPGSYRSMSYPNYLDLRESSQAFEEVAVYTPAMVGLEEGGATRRVMGMAVSADYFSVFGMPLVLGRSFTTDETQPDADIRVAVVSHDWWRRAELDPEVLGRPIEINGRTFTIIGVARRGFTGSSVVIGPEVWLPLGTSRYVLNDLITDPGQRDLTDRASHTLMTVAQLDAGVTLAAADADLAAVASRLEQAYPAANADHTFLAAPLSRVSLGSSPQDDTEVMALAAHLMGMAAVVLLIACLNLANLLLARGGARRQEIAIRQALGGGRRRLLGQLMTEGLLLSLAGGTLGLLVANWVMTGLVSSIAPLFPFSVTLMDVSVDVRVVAGMLAFCMLATLLFGLGPALRLTRTDLVSDLKQQVVVGSRKRDRLLAGRNLLVVGQVALSLTLLVSGGLFLRGALLAAAGDPGFSFEKGLIVETDPSLVGYDEDEGRQLYRSLLDRLRAVPGVEAASAGSLVPFGPVSEGQRLESVGAARCRCDRSHAAPRHRDDRLLQLPGVADPSWA